MTSPACARHPGRETGVRCTRCDRPACSDCLREASVGYQCVDCVAQAGGSQRVITAPWAAPAGRAVVVPTLIAINVAVFVVTVAQAGNVSGSFAAALMENGGAPLFRQWALWHPALAGGEWWRLLTSGFLHFGLIHLAFNMIALWVIGQDLELVLGRVRFLAIYLVSLLGGSLAVFLLGASGTLTAGASGAVFGLLGGLVIVLLRMGRSPRPALTIILLNVIITFAVPQISILGHLGGLAFGTAITAGMVYAPTSRR